MPKDIETATTDTTSPAPVRFAKVLVAAAAGFAASELAKKAFDKAVAARPTDIPT